jgi:shikimate kinase
MSYYIIIRGPLGCGKSTISKELAKELDAEYIPMDDLLEENGLDKIDKELGYIPAKNFIKADEIVLPTVNNLLRLGKVVVIDGCFYHEEQVEHLQKNLDFIGFVFNLKLSLEKCIERDSKRKKKYGKDAAKAVYELVEKYKTGIDIDVDKPVKECVDEVLKYFLEFLRK